MSKRHEKTGKERREWRGQAGALAVFLCLSISLSLAQPAPPAQLAAPPAPRARDKITPEQAQQLFGVVDQLIKFSSDETGLPIRSQVKRQFISRDAVESYLKHQMDDDQAAKRMQRDEIVLKKFGLLDRDFDLQPFLLSLLKEQIAAYYDSKTKTVYLLDWVSAEEQKPILAHELTHALQDQHSDLEKWGDQTPDDVSLNATADTDHLTKDEMDTARQAVVEGQATAVQMDYILKPMGKSLVKDPEVIDFVKQQMSESAESPVLARAPLLISASLLFPYSDGLSFEQAVWMDQGRTAAFAGTLDRPPTSSWEILNPRYYEKRETPPVPLLPDIHPLVDKLYTPYDIGQMGQLDVRILTQLFGGEQASRDLTAAWDGGLYWAGQRRSATTPEERSSTNSIALFYLSAWKNAESAQAFAHVYAGELGHKYSDVKLVSASRSLSPSGPSPGFSVFPPHDSSPDDGEDSTPSDPHAPPGEQVYSTSEGPVVITTRGRLVFVAESLPLDVARKLAALVLDAQGGGEMHLAQIKPSGAPSLPRLSAKRVGDHQSGSPESMEPLSGDFIRFFSDCGVMKAAMGIRFIGTNPSP